MSPYKDMVVPVLIGDKVECVPPSESVLITHVIEQLYPNYDSYTTLSDKEEIEILVK